MSNYSKGINGIMVDLQGAGNHSSITLANILSDFTFKVGSNNTPSTWATAPNPVSVTLRAGAGAGGSDRVELIWADNAIKETWIEVIVKANSDTGLTQLASTGTLAGVGAVFFYGNAAADDFTGSETTLASPTRPTTWMHVLTTAWPRSRPTGITTRTVFVNSSDSLAARVSASLRYIKIANPPAAPQGDPGASPDATPSVTTAAVPSTSSDSGIATALTALATTNVSSGQIPGWIASRLSNVNLNTGIAATIIEDLAKAAKATAWKPSSPRPSW